MRAPGGRCGSMDALDRVVKPKTKRAKRFLEKREPKLSENIKNAMLIKGGNASSTVTQVLRDVYALKKPYGVLYKKKNITRPFEDQTSLEFFSKKSDCSLFMFGSHNKKRPNNLVIGRLYDYHVLDMIERPHSIKRPPGWFRVCSALHCTEWEDLLSKL